MREAGLTVKPGKCMFGFSGIEFLGHEVTSETLSPRVQKVNEILNAEVPKTKRQVKSFLAMVGYYAKFIARFSDITEPLTSMIKKGSPNVVKWNDEADKAFTLLKQLLSKRPVLAIFDTDGATYVQSDASDVGLGAALLQLESGKLHPVRYLSRKLTGAERNYSTIEKECLAIVWAIQKLKVFLYGREFILLVDNKPLVYLNEANLKNARVMRWAMFLQDWSFRVESIKGSDNHCADYLSRSHNETL